jgi:(2Fe-2S) ferredoxin
VPRRTRPAARTVRGCSVIVCRGCCSGTARKHPGVDHAAQVAALTEGIGDAGLVRASDCLDACERSNVVVVAPSPAARREGARAVWLAGVLHPDTLADIVAWVREGGPGVAEPPVILDLSAFSPSRRSRAASADICGYTDGSSRT